MPTAKNTVSHTVYRNSAQLSELAQPRVLSHHNTPKTVRKVSAVPRKAPGIQVSSKLSANTGQKTVHTSKRCKTNKEEAYNYLMTRIRTFKGRLISMRLCR